jgi:predicted phosphate transport protein (TIGR00153 family)
MKKGRLIMAKKKDYDYFAFFCHSADIACEAAEYLHKSLVEYSKDSFEENMKEIHAIEHKADSVKNEMIEVLAHEFIAPIDREDISRMAHILDDIVDDIDDIMRRIYMFNIETIRPDAVDFAELIVKSTKAMKKAMWEFRNFKKSKELGSLLLAVNDLETEGDQMQSNCIRKLFTEDSDAVTKLVWTTIFDDMEACMDNCDNAVGVIEGVVMKNI